MLHKLTSDICVLVLPYGQGKVNSYLVRGEKGYTVIDTGSSMNETKEIWKSLINKGIVLEKVVITHAHRDHMGLAAWLQKECHVPIMMSKRAYDLRNRLKHSLTHWEGERDLPSQLYASHSNLDISESSYLEEKIGEHIEPNDLYEDDQTLTFGTREMKAIYTPGHSVDHYCFWDPNNNVLFSADLIVNTVPMWTEVEGSPLHDLFHSLDRMSKYPVQLTLPGHGRAFNNLTERILNLRNSHLEINASILSILSTGSRSAGQLKDKIVGQLNSNILNRMQVATMIARLIYLEREKLVTRSYAQDKIAFQLPSHSSLC